MNPSKILRGNRKALKANVCSLNLIPTAGLVQDSRLQDCISALNSGESQRSTTTAAKSSLFDTPTPTTTETCRVFLPEVDTGLSDYHKTELSQEAHPVNHSLFKESAEEPTTSETDSQHCLRRSPPTNLSSVRSRMLSDCLPVLTNQEASSCISATYSGNWTSAGMMRNGSVSAADTLPPPLLENGYCWLESPGAFSTSGNSRPPGLNRLETFLKRKGLLSKGEVLSPVILSEWYSLPPTYLDPSESRTAAQLLEDSERQLEIFLIPALRRSHSDESFTSTPCSPEEFLEEKHDLPPGHSSTKSRAESEPELSSKKKPSGCLYRYLEHKKLKSGMIASYPRVEGDRDPDNIDHWRWAYNWEEKIHDDWKNRSIAVPKHLVSAIRTMISVDTPALEIREFIKSWKIKKRET